jgi:anti-repressor protein
MKELIKITKDEQGISVVSGRDLHEFLGINTEYKKWFNRMTEYGFTENADFVRVTQKCHTPGGIQNITDHAMILDMAKEISMIQRTNKGKQARQYFIEVEKEFRKQCQLPQTPEEKLELTMQVTTRINKRLGKVEEKIDEIQNKSEIDSDQRYKLWVARNKKAVKTLGGKDSNAYKNKILSRRVFRVLEREFKEAFVISRYEDLKKENFDKAIDFIDNWYPPCGLNREIEAINSQENLF